MTEYALLRWIPLLPLLGAVIHGVMIGVVRRVMPRWWVAVISCGAVAASFLLSLVAFFRLIELPGNERGLSDSLYTWIGVGIGDTRLAVDLGFALDPLSAVMLLVVTGVGAVIHVYSIGYMEDDEREDRGFQRFFCFLNLFLFSMLMLVLADNLVLMFLGWELVGLCSYLLIGFWYSDRDNAYCGSKAFVVNRIGDFGFLLGTFLLFVAFAQVDVPATLTFTEMEAQLATILELTLAVPAWLPLLGGEWPLVDLIALCFFLAACGKSAQFPLYVWLPDAMAGPTPVSALIHAATMVTAGVYMVGRLSFLYTVAPDASAVMAWTGGATALLAAAIAVAQTDIKKVLAYSTVSQLGYMFMAAGCGAYTGAIFHLVTHAFFKALLFLAAGSVILAMRHEQDIGKMGGLGRRVVRTKGAFLVGVWAISGLPPLSGFFSKDAILVSVWGAEVPGHGWLYGVGLFTAFLTAFYVWRLHFLIFWGKCRAPMGVRDRIRESPPVILWPLYVLAAFAAFGGLLGIPQVVGDWLGVDSSHSLDNFLSPVLASVPHGVAHETELWLALCALAMAGLGLALAHWLYVADPDRAERMARTLPTLRRVLHDKLYVDELYDVAVVRPLLAFSNRVLFRAVDAGLIDGLVVNGTARTVRATAEAGLKYLQSGQAQSYILTMLVGTAAILGYLLR